MLEMRLVLVNNKYTGESKKQVMFINNDGSAFHGALFWRHDDEVKMCNRVRRILDTYFLDCTDLKSRFSSMIAKYIEWCKENDIKVFDDTPRTMLHWQFMNGFSEFYFDKYAADSIIEDSMKR